MAEKRYDVRVKIDGWFTLRTMAESADEAMEQVGATLDDDGWQEWIDTAIEEGISTSIDMAELVRGTGDEQ